MSSSVLGDFSDYPLDLTFKLRRGVSTRWESVNTVLAAGEPGVELDTDKFKIGDGFTPWNDLPYYLNEDSTTSLIAQMISDAPSIGGGGVTETEFQEHVDSELPHTTYDDGTSFELRYQNAKV